MSDAYDLAQTPRVRVGRYIPVTTSGAPVVSSGQAGFLLIDQNGALQVAVAPVSGQPIVASISGQVVQISGTPIQLQSGVAVVASGLQVRIESGTQTLVNMASGSFVGQPQYASVTASTLVVGTSGAAFASNAGGRFIFSVQTSTIYYIGPPATVNSGVGYIMGGAPPTNYLDVTLSNLNLLGGIAGGGVSGRISVMRLGF